MNTTPPESDWKHRLYIIVFEADTRAGRLFDVCLIYAIVLSLVVVMLDSVAGISSQYHSVLFALEWFFTVLFTLEYIARLLCTPRPLRYAFSFFGVVDLLAILPTYLALLVPGLHALIDVRVLRLLRVFRVFKLTHYFGEYTFLANAVAASRRKILVFLSVVLMAVMVFGTLMYVIEGPENGFTSIPVSVYWGITTMTTVGFGDIAPKTDLGRLIASCMMLMVGGTGRSCGDCDDRNGSWARSDACAYDSDLQGVPDRGPGPTRQVLQALRMQAGGLRERRRKRRVTPRCRVLPARHYTLLRFLKALSGA